MSTSDAPELKETNGTVATAAAVNDVDTAELVDGDGKNSKQIVCKRCPSKVS